MKTNLHWLTLSLFLFGFGYLKAQTYCSPTFTNGCSTWSNQAITLEAINWTQSDCNISDFTSMLATLTPGLPQAMSVESGTWTGCAVYVDFDNNGDFVDIENLYHSYVGGDPTYNYNFTITVPTGTPDGNYRLRVIAGWGTDGFTPSANGNGGCGTYEYGNFNDFTLTVSSASVGLSNRTINSIAKIAPNPANEFASIQLSESIYGTLIISDFTGKTVREVAVNGQQKLDLNTSNLTSGIYFVRSANAPNLALKFVVAH